MRNIPDSHLAFPVLISLGNSSGSGFVYRTDSFAYLVTAKHVLFDESEKLRSEEIEITCQTNNLQDDSVIRIRILLNDVKLLFENKTDVALVKFAKITTKNEKEEFIITYLKGATRLQAGISNPVYASRKNVNLLQEVIISNDIYVYGYPTSLGIETNKQFDFNRPLLRKGVIANVYKVAETIILDCPVYGGNSGGPVIQVIRQKDRTDYKLIGVISQYIPYVQRWKNDRERLSHVEYLNSGYSVATSFDPILKLIDADK